MFDAKNYSAAMNYLMKPDAQKDPKAMNLIGYMYNIGRGVRENHEEAFKWYRRAAEAGLSISQFNLGLMYQHGRGVNKDINEAVKWFLKAAAQNDPDAEMKMGYLAAKGIGIKQDYQQAMKWFRRASEHGDNKGYVNIGIMYDKGDGVKKDPNRLSSITSWAPKKEKPKHKVCWEHLMNSGLASPKITKKPSTGTRKPPKMAISMP